MRNRVFLICLILLLGIGFGHAAKNGDYRSKKTGLWSEPNNWERYTGLIWLGPTNIYGPPDYSKDIITILNGHTMSVDRSTRIDETVINQNGKVHVLNTGELLVTQGPNIDLEIYGELQVDGTLGGGDTIAEIFNRASGKIYLNGNYSYVGTLNNYGTTTVGTKQMRGTVNNYGTIKSDRTDMMYSGTLTHQTGSTIEYTSVLRLPGSNQYKNLTLSAPGVYYMDGDLTGIQALTLGQNSYLHRNSGKTVSYVSCNAPERIIDNAVISIASQNPAIPAGNISQAAKKHPIYRFSLSRNQFTGSVDFTGLSFNSSGTAAGADIERFQLWVASADNFASATQLGDDISADLGTGTHSFSGINRSLNPNNTSYYWITADIKSSATTGSTLTVAALNTTNITITDGTKVATTYAGGTQTVSALSTAASSPDTVPAGNIVPGSTKNTIYRFRLQSTGQNTLNALSFKRLAGGTSLSSADIDRIQLWGSTTNDLTSANHLGSDMLTIATNATTDNSFANVSYTLESGKTHYFWITVDLKGTATIGSAITVAALNTSNIGVSGGTKTSSAAAGGKQTVSNAYVTLSSSNPALPAEKIDRGTTSNPIYAFSLKANGNNTLNSIAFVASGTNLATNVVKYQLWASLNNSFFLATQIGSDITSIPTSGSTVTFSSLSFPLPDNALYHFWISADLANNATAGNTITVAALGASNVGVAAGTASGTAYAGGAQSIAGAIALLKSSNPSLPAGYITLGSERNPLYRFALTRNAASGVLNITGLSFQTTGTYAAADISKFQLWSSEIDNCLNASMVSGAEITTNLGTGAHSFSFSLSLQPSETRYFWISVGIQGSGANKTIQVPALATTNFSINGGTMEGSAFNGGVQTFGEITVAISSPNPAVPASRFSQNMKKRPLQRFSLQSSGNVTIASISFTTAGTYYETDIARFQLWTGTEDELESAGKLGNDITSNQGIGTHSFSNLGLALNPGEPQYFWITGDTSGSPISPHTIYIPGINGSNISLSIGNITGSGFEGGEQMFCHLCTWTTAKGQIINQLDNAGTGYQVKVNVYRSSGIDGGENVYVGGDCREDFGDIRFFEGDIPLSYWMEKSVFGDYASFWVKMHGDLSSSNLYLTMRYGHPGATTTSDGPATFLFFDDFNRTDHSYAKWNVHKHLDNSTVNIPKGSNFMRLGDGSDAGTYGHVVLGSDKTYSSFVNGAIEYRFRNSLNAICEVGFRGDFNANTGYKGRGDSRNNGTNGGHSFMTPPYYSWAHMSDSPDQNTNQPIPDTWYRGTITVYNNDLKLLRDGTQYASSNMASSLSPGEISLQNHYGDKVDYDWIAVRKHVENEPSRGAWLAVPMELLATAENYNGFTARWNVCDGAIKYYLDLFDADGVPVTNWQNVEATTNALRIEPLESGTSYRFRVKAQYSSLQSSGYSHTMGHATTAVITGNGATTCILGASALAYVPSVFDGGGNNNVQIASGTNSSDDFKIVISYHPAGYDIWPNGRLLATISSTNNAALNASYTINHADMGFKPQAAAFRWGEVWYHSEADFSEDHTTISIPNLAKNYGESLEILLDDGSGTLPVELSSFTATLAHQAKVKLQWVTQSETNMQGFRILRGMSDELDAAEYLSTFIDATNTSQAQVYVFYDDELVLGAINYYWLESLDYDGSGQYFGPVILDLGDLGQDTPPIPILPGIQTLYPNPFNPSTTIKVGHIQQGALKISIYNQKGQLVNTLVNEEKKAGNYSYIWYGRDNSGRTLPSGLYFIKLQSGAKSYLRKAILMK